MGYHNPFRRAKAGSEEDDKENMALLNSKLDQVRAEVEARPEAVAFKKSFSLQHPFMATLGLTSLSAVYLKAMKLSLFPAGVVFIFSLAYFHDRAAINRYSFWLENYHLLNEAAQMTLRTGDHRYLNIDPSRLKAYDKSAFII